VASDYIRTLVFTGVLRTGDKVPVDDIANVLDISRQPVREALIELAHDGLVNTDGRRGTFVADFGPSIVRDHYELYGLLHSFAMRRVATERDPQVIEALHTIEHQARTTLDVTEVTRLAIEFARTINRAAGNARLRQVIRAMSRFTPGEYYLANIPDALKRNRSGLRAQLAAIEAGDAEGAASLTLQSWINTGEALIAHLQSTGVFPEHADSTTTNRTTTRS
jgi:DNA-binding GntR family transcriptional regulator